MMQTTTDMMMAAWRQTGGALPATSLTTGADEPLAAGPYFTATNGRGCITGDEALATGPLTNSNGRICLDIEATLTTAAITFRVPGCVAGDEAPAAAAVSWHGGICSPEGAA